MAIRLSHRDKGFQPSLNREQRQLNRQAAKDAKLGISKTEMHLASDVVQVRGEFSLFCNRILGVLGILAVQSLRCRWG